MENSTIPSQISGGFHDTVSMYCAKSLQNADNCFKILKARLKDVNAWETYSDEVKASFMLFDGSTNESTDILEKGNLIRIDIPGIGNPSGKGYDWTKIVDIQQGTAENHSFFLMTIKPCALYDKYEEPVAHFYGKEASNTFVVRKVGKFVYAEVHGRNEIQNCVNVPWTDKVRNKAVAIGSKIGLGDLNWLGFTNALVKPFKDEKLHR